MNAQLVKRCHALSQVTNHAPNKPMITPIRGLETANQNGITSLNEMTSRPQVRFQKSLSYLSAYCSTWRLRLRVCWIFEPPWLDYSGLLGSQGLHFCAAWNVGWPFVWNDNLWSVKPPRSLLKQMSSGFKFDLIKDEDLSRDKPDCETDHQCA